MSDIESAVEKIKSMMGSSEGQTQLKDLIGKFTGGENVDMGAIGNMLSGMGGGGSNEESTAPSFNMPDMDMMIKMQKVMSMLNTQKTSKNSTFLQSLKPFLSENRRSKVDMASTMMNFSKISSVFKDMNQED